MALPQAATSLPAGERYVALTVAPDDQGLWLFTNRGRVVAVGTARLHTGGGGRTDLLDLDEAPRHPHNAARGTFTELEGVVQPAPAPRLDRTPAAIQGPPAKPGEHTRTVLTDWGFGEDNIEELKRCGAI